MRRQVAYHFKTIPETLYLAYDVFGEADKDRLNFFRPARNRLIAPMPVRSYP